MLKAHERKVLRGGHSTLRAHMPAIIVEIEQRHRTEPIEETFDYRLDLRYVGYFLDWTGLQPLSKFSVERHQLAAIPPGFVPHGMPTGYVNDFLFVNRNLSRSLLGTT